MSSLFQKKMNKFGITLVSLLIAVIFLAACGNENNNNNNETASNANSSADTTSAAPASDAGNAERTFKDAMGHEVKVPANPQKVLGSYLEDYLVALNVTPVAQWSVADGTSVQDYLQSSLSGVPTINYDLPPEQVAGLNPDFIIIGSESSVEKGLYDQYNAIAPTYVLGDALNNDWRKSLETIGDLLGKQDEAKQVLADYDQKAKDTKSKIEGAIGQQSAVALWLTQKNFYMVKDSVASGDVLYHDLGFAEPALTSDISKSATSDWNAVPMEQLANLDADQIFLINSDGADSETLKSGIWQGLKAVKNGNVHEVDQKGGWLYKGAIAGEAIMDELAKILVK